MQRDMKLLQTNYCCISDDEMIYVTEQNKVFVKMNLLTKAAKIMNKDILQNRVEYICTYCLLYTSLCVFSNTYHAGVWERQR